MSLTEKRIIQQFKELASKGYLTPYESQWCIGAIRNRHGLTKTTRHALRDEVQKYIALAQSRALKDKQ